MWRLFLMMKIRLYRKNLLNMCFGIIIMLKDVKFDLGMVIFPISILGLQLK